MPLTTNRQSGDLIQAADINTIATQVNTNESDIAAVPVAVSTTVVGTATVTSYELLVAPVDVTITDLDLFAGTSPTGSALTVAVTVNGVASSLTASIADGGTTGSGASSVAVTAGQRLGISVTAIGSTTAGSDVLMTASGVRT